MKYVKVYFAINAMKNRSCPNLMQKVKSSNGSFPIPFLCLSKLLELNFPSSCSTTISVAENLKMKIGLLIYRFIHFLQHNPNVC